MAENDPTDRLLDHLRSWAADDETARVTRSRSRARWLRQQAAESASLAGVLLDLAEHRAVVTVEAGARAHLGRLVAVSTALCVLEEIDDAEHHLAFVPLGGITMLVSPVQATGDRIPNLQLDLAAALAGLAVDRPTVSLELNRGKRVTGVLETVGLDIVNLRMDDPDGVVAQLPINAISACLL